MNLRNFQVKKLTVLAIAIVIMTGCAGTSKLPENVTIRSYTLLETAADSHRAYKQIAITLYKNDVISNEDRDKVIEFSREYKIAYDLAVAALYAYEKARTVESHARLDTALELVDKILLQFIVLFNQKTAGGTI